MVHQGNTPFHPNLSKIGLHKARNIWWNLPPARLIERTLLAGEGKLTSTGAIAIETGRFTGRSPLDRFIVKDDTTRDEVWWGEINQPVETEQANRLHADMMDYIDGKGLYVRDAFVGADAEFRKGVRVMTEKAWSNLFAYNMFIRPTAQEVGTFAPDWHVVCAPGFMADPERHGTRQANFAILDFTHQRVLIGGTGYTGEIKKGMFSAMNFLLPTEFNVLPMHCSANEGADGSTAVFFGLSGTGKTTLSSDPKRKLIGDDEHGWGPQGIFNFEGGCYAKTIDLDPAREPDIHAAIQHGAMLENIGFEADGVTPDYTDSQTTQNTRVSYPIGHIKGAKPSGQGGHPEHIFFLTCDAFGVLPPLARLDAPTAMYHFISGYTAKVAGTEDGIDEPKAVFSACFGAPFLPLHPGRYADMLGERMEAHGAKVWLVNTGWTGGPHGVGHRMALKDTRALLDAVLNGSMDGVAFRRCSRFGWEVPVEAPGVDSALLDPRNTWSDGQAFDAKADSLSERFNANFAQFEMGVTEAVRKAAPKTLVCVA
ncbi:phosphoenolpyruvate carboxykinase (ATP) [Flavobacteriales bacterium]|nr:phosphoenolpyruvate carboxykinase (ATP) [Flavobacteriales bacterium]